MAIPGKLAGSAVARIEIGETGCFGPCPIYEVAVDRGGGVAYVGRRHVAVVGPASATLAPSLFDAVAKLLEPWRPAKPGNFSVNFSPAAMLFSCGDYATDGGEFVVEWTGADGTRRLELDRGCQSSQSQAFQAKVREALALLPSVQWAAQRDR